MKNIKATLILLSFLFTIPLFGQDASEEKIKARLSCVKKKTEQRNDEWTDWTNWERSYATIVHNRDSNKFTVYDEGKISEYYILDSFKKVKDEVGDIIKEWSCVSSDKEPCTIKMVTLKTYKVKVLFFKVKQNKKQFYIELPNRKMAYHLK